ncbi:acetylornithine deacetylase/succinyl-diaminopimelate desuccinylase-like protein [Actinocorallia herbida]|uniref:Acetylornithine deacetylase/succinyl-diaminopimelate desuccinylase-like protein n=1 Tax=Actinocorallia herbida TaxID=58109 RepID=A0A3N1D0P6_9ACTN|nr:peptidase dimerization domain-containing protein [Actinocorallia herbida]ROO87107.1 acetylornithine deacetylase/succinyl-diaminopimelate desuccinylase-like protein [Actinocorallia herbida]
MPDAAAPLDPERAAWAEAARARVDDARLTELVVGMVSIPSPTGEEGPLARWLADRITEAGLEGRYQPIDARQGNAVGRLRGDGTGADLLLYAPIDTLSVGTEEEDVPQVGPVLRPDMRPEAVVDGPFVIGLGASNPKGHGAAVIAAAEAVAAAGIPLRGDLLVGLGAGGMPTNARPGARFNAGQGNGCSFMLEQGVWADHAVIAKPGWTAAWEEVGLCWFEVTVRGTYGYVGSRHRMPYRNPIVDAGTVIAGLEAWLPRYAARHTSGLVAPQGNVGWIEGGWRRTASLSPAACRFHVDLRISPRTTPAEARREFAAAIDGIRAAHPEIDLDWEMTVSIPGTATPESDWIIRAGKAAWEEAEGRPHEPILNNSGATDANILRARGLSTLRTGMDRIGPDAPLALDFPAGMNVVDVREARRLVRALIRIIVDTCTRPREETL